VDASWSVTRSAHELVQAVLLSLVDLASPEIRISVGYYGLGCSRSTNLVFSEFKNSTQPLKQQVKDFIYHDSSLWYLWFYWFDRTETHSALAKAQALFMSPERRQSAKSLIILFSDGQHDNVQAARSISERLKLENNVTIFTIATVHPIPVSLVTMASNNHMYSLTQFDQVISLTLSAVEKSRYEC